MEPTEVLKKYLELCSSNHFQDFLYDNSILEWFGRSIKGKMRINNCLRYEICPEYDQIFLTAQSCSPIEYRATHEATKITLPSIEFVKEISIELKYTTPIKFSCPILPELTKGRTFLEVDHDMELLFDMGLDHLKNSDDICAITPPRNVKTLPDNDEPLRKKKKISNDHANAAVTTAAFDISSNDTVKKNNYFEEESPDYSRILYFESIGKLHTSYKKKYHVTNSLYDNDINGRDRNTKLKISYRLIDSQIIFLLIIYEHLTRNPNLRRNLIREFQQTSVKKKLNNSTEIAKRKKSLQRI